MKNLAVVMLSVSVTLSFGASLVCRTVAMTRLRVVWPPGRLGVKLFLLFKFAEQLDLPSIVPSVRQILVFYCIVLVKAGVLTGVTTNLRTLMPELVRDLLPRTPTTGIGSIRVPGLLMQWHRGSLVDRVVVSVVVSEILRTVPVLSCDPPGALLRLTTVRLTSCRLSVLAFRTRGVTLLLMVVIVLSIFPFLQWVVLLL